MTVPEGQLTVLEGQLTVLEGQLTVLEGQLTIAQPFMAGKSTPERRSPGGTTETQRTVETEPTASH